jgi:hypothetical protein
MVVTGRETTRFDGGIKESVQPVRSTGRCSTMTLKEAGVMCAKFVRIISGLVTKWINNPESEVSDE